MQGLLVREVVNRGDADARLPRQGKVTGVDGGMWKGKMGTWKGPGLFLIGEAGLVQRPFEWPAFNW